MTQQRCKPSYAAHRHHMMPTSDAASRLPRDPNTPKTPNNPRVPRLNELCQHPVLPWILRPRVRPCPCVRLCPRRGTFALELLCLARPIKPDADLHQSPPFPRGAPH
eukprot:9057210-Lingulodinium_polyedra.AAC.1